MNQLNESATFSFSSFHLGRSLNLVTSIYQDGQVAFLVGASKFCAFPKLIHPASLVSTQVSKCLKHFNRLDDASSLFILFSSFDSHSSSKFSNGTATTTTTTTTTTTSTNQLHLQRQLQARQVIATLSTTSPLVLIALNWVNLCNLRARLVHQNETKTAAKTKTETTIKARYLLILTKRRFWNKVNTLYPLSNFRLKLKPILDARHNSSNHILAQTDV